MNKNSINRKLLFFLFIIILVGLLFFLWWIGLFIPKRIEWKNKKFDYENMEVRLKNHKITLCDNSASRQNFFFKTKWDVNIQDVLHYDIDQDGREELVMLVWKHGSYGKHLPNWVKHNDIRLEQHIFIYRYEETRDNKLRAIWMSSALGYEVASVSQGANGRLCITDKDGNRKYWQWEDFGLKLTEQVKNEVSFACVGDNLIHTKLLQQGTVSYDHFYENIKEEIECVDFASINQETVLVNDQGLISDYPRFGSPEEIGTAVADTGFDIITLANNHALDKESYGVDTTLDFFRQYEDITCIGTHASNEKVDTPEESVYFVTKNGIKIALLNYTYGTNGIPSPKEFPNMVERFSDEQRVAAQLDYAHENADVVIVFAHWGTEYSSQVDEEQKRLCNFLLQHEVDVVIGTHPHVLQPFELLTGEKGHQMLVYYSLGNFLSGQDKKECLIGGIARFYIIQTIKGDIKIQDYSLKRVMTNHSNDRYMVNLLKEDTNEGDVK